MYTVVDTKFEPDKKVPQKNGRLNKKIVENLIKLMNLYSINVFQRKFSF